MLRFTLRLLLLGAATLCALPSASAQPAERLRVHGSDSLGARLMPALVESWLQSMGYRQIQRRRVAATTLEIAAVRDDAPLVVEIAGTGSAAGIADLVHGDAELAMLARQPDAHEREAAWQLGDLGSPDQQFVVALDGARVLVAADNPIAMLSVTQLRDILSGRVTRWSQVGGADRPIALQRRATPGGLDDFLRERLALPALRAADVLHPDLAAAARAVAGHPDALAIVGLTTPVPAGTRALAIADGGIAVAPTAAAVRGEDYPLVQRYSLYGGQMMSALGRSLALYAIGPQAQQLVRRLGPISMAIDLDAATPPSATAAASADTAYPQATTGARRLTTTLRFSLQSLNGMYEARSAQDLDRLVAFMHQPAMHGRAVAVIGFATPDSANRLYPTIASNDRADVVAAYLVQRDVAVERVRGLGALRPLIGGEDSTAKVRNERVELWLLDRAR